MYYYRVLKSPNTVKPGHLATSIQRESPLSVHILVLPIAFTLN